MKTTTSPDHKTTAPFNLYLDKKQSASCSVFTLWTKTREDRQKLLKNSDFAQQFVILRSETECLLQLSNMRSGNRKPWLLVEPSGWKGFGRLFKKISRKKKMLVFLLDQSMETSYLAERIFVVDNQGEVVDVVETSF
ncbi:MAG: hypothetical protein J5I98_25195 [Phaeodactylibacter sp.]|nr:hypothetical protein [Phaeodactylibacter sp.]